MTAPRSTKDIKPSSARMLRTFRFKLKPTRAQHNRLRDALEHARQLYNAALSERIDCYRKTGRGRTFIDQCGGLVELRRDPSFAIFPTVMQRGALRSVDHAYRAFFKRGGFPRFKGRDRFKTLSWPQAQGFRFDGKFHSKGIGSVRVQQHRAIPTDPISCKITRAGRNWFLLLHCVVEPLEANDNDKAVGLDLGLSSFAALSDGTLIPNPRRGRKAQRDIRRRQRALARCKRGSRRRAKVRQRLADAFRGVQMARRTFHFQTAADLTRRFGLIAVEDLNVRGLAGAMLARDVNDASWGQFIRILCDKAESAGRKVLKVSPHGTSQTCPECGQVAKKLLSERTHRCDCGYEADRDVAAARVILMRAVHGPPEHNVGGRAVRAPRKAVA